MSLSRLSLGTEFTQSLLGNRDIVSNALNYYYFDVYSDSAPCFIEGVDWNLIESAPAYIEGWVHEIVSNLALGDQDGRITMSNILPTGGESALALNNWTFNVATAHAHAYIFSVGHLTASAHAYINAIMRASAHCYIRGGIVVTQSAHAYINGVAGVFMRASAHAFINGQYTDLPGPALWTT